MTRAKLDTTCPNNHNLTVTFSEDEFESALKSDALILHCNTCDANWSPTRADIESIQKQFAPRK